jgi:hypothetical protein
MLKSYQELKREAKFERCSQHLDAFFLENTFLDKLSVGLCILFLDAL